MALTELTRALDEAGAQYEVLPHEHTESAADEARALGLSPDEVAKTLVVKTPDGYVRCVLPGSCRIELRKVGDLVQASKKKVHLASEDDLARDYGEFELGAVPPFGGSRGDPVIVDRRVAERESVVLEAGTHDESLRIATSDLVALTKAQVADVCEE